MRTKTLPNIRSTKRLAARHVDRLTALARFGFLAKGVVYVTVGALALRMAAAGGGEAQDTHGALDEIGRQPFGQLMLWILAAGLVCYAVWRIVEGVTDPDRLGASARAITRRAGRIASGVFHGGLAIYAFNLAVGLGAAPKEPASLTAELMSRPFGRWLVALAGAIVIATAVAQFRRSYCGEFMMTLRERMTTTARPWIRRLGKAGLAARGVVFAIVGLFLIVAAWQSDPYEAIGLDGALEKIARQPYGVLLLALVAAGLLLYGVFQFVAARYKRFAL
ncbi:MAG: DUF1206 domain-containing protein [Bryobacteraceae bacterium]|nr:DUF1206 domain-containing protein [Bryobacteraceae bacterium]